MPSTRPLLLLCALAACEDDSGNLQRVRGVIELAPEEVDFGEVALEVTVEREFTLTNGGNGNLTVESLEIDGAPSIEGLTVAGDGVFGIVPYEGPDRLPPGASRTFTLTARPIDVFQYRTLLRVRTDAGEATAVLRLRGVPQPDCEDNNPCTDSFFDVDRNDCAIEFADGNPCQPADRCIINGICAQGVCLGESKVCSDDSICTRDVCRQADGSCVFIEDLSQCDDDNPCTADACGPQGCVHEPVLNGQACDDGNECTTNDACFGGQCLGASLQDGSACDDGDSCTINTACIEGVCVGDDIVASAEEGDVIFNFVLPSEGFQRAFLHRREMSLSDDGVLVGLDHRSEFGGSFQHVVFGMKQCGTPAFEYRYRPPGGALVRYVRRALQIDAEGRIQVIVGVRQLPENGYRPETTSFELKPDGSLCELGAGDDCRRGRKIKAAGGETGWSLTPDGSFISGVVVNPNPDFSDPADDVFTILRETQDGDILWQHNRSTQEWAEFLGVAGSRVLFWSQGRFGALDFANGNQVWSRFTGFIPKEMALSTELNLGVGRAGDQLIGVDLLEGEERFRFPVEPDGSRVPRTDPVISSEGRILFVMEEQVNSVPTGLSWVELSIDGEQLSSTPLPYQYPLDPFDARHEDFGDDPYPTVADDGVTYVGYGDTFWAIDPGGDVRWTLTSTVNGFTGTVPLLRDDGVLLLSTTSREIIGVKTNGGRMDTEAWSSFRNDTRRSNYTP